MPDIWKLPLRVLSGSDDHGSDHFVVFDKEDILVARCISKEVAEQIVRAINTRQELLDTLERCGTRLSLALDRNRAGKDKL